MLTTIILNGHLGDKFGRRWKFDIETTAEVIRAMEVARPGFQKAVIGAGRLAYRVRVGKRGIEARHLQLPNAGRTITITPVIEGAAGSGKGIAQIIVGVVLVAAGIIIGIGSSGTLTIVAAQLVMLGIGSILGGVSQLLAPSPENSATKKNKGSYLFQTPINTMEQGGPVALTYGRPFQGSQVISADMIATDITKGSKKASAPGDNTGNSLTTTGEAARSAYDVGSTVEP